MAVYIYLQLSEEVICLCIRKGHFLKAPQKNTHWSGQQVVIGDLMLPAGQIIFNHNRSATEGNTERDGFDS